ncbi:TPA: MBOAT family O-acyltransferase [Legionella pneumophila]|uniref:MBOAT family O-acyltransferase n=1 Tax=Legionella pneumophila TaxID=446 RepID=UPI0004849C1A|nr:MBOAT family O-acyltransferase [Legionella pneumophila]BCL64369.1 alginate O-acetylation protein [Legionella pneumophila serogroup 2]MCK1858165.1 MBOAT family protein [Legionella pneumophila]RYW93386.1 MBOAT family protein [Legionella pneumophila]STX98265.1 alginate O-acetyltransferase AlgI [Legionella pneumophila]HAT1774465.1 MBOAT family protein [Legionella pneumophila]
MLFTSQLFIFFFLPVACCGVFFSHSFFGKQGSILAIIGFSFAFYYLNGQAQLPLLLTSIAVNHIFIKIIVATKDTNRKNFLTGLAILLNILALIYYKYGIFLVKQYESLKLVISQHIPLNAWSSYIDGYNLIYPWGYSGEMIILPLGISFFTFQQIAYILDLRNGRVKNHHFLDYLFCVTFFPHLIAGPIVNYRELIPQLKNKKILIFKNTNLLIGLAIFSFGLFKKAIIADTLAEIVNPVFDGSAHGANINFISAWLSAIAYTLQIYFDFSGYSDMAIGLARIFGVKLPVNFASPYKATSIIEFWQRWHITLSRFLKNYLYIPLGGNRYGQLLKYRNLLLTMTIGGLWHGAGWTFVIWGVLHGILLSINHLWREQCNKFPGLKKMMPSWMSRILTLLAVVVLWVFFRASSVDSATKILSAMIFPDFGSEFIAFSWKYSLILIAGYISLCLPSTQQLFSRYYTAIPPQGLPDFTNGSVLTWRINIPWLLATTILAAVACFYSTDFPQFLYWNF